MSQCHAGVRCKHLTELYIWKKGLKEQSCLFVKLERSLPEPCVQLLALLRKGWRETGRVQWECRDVENMTHMGRLEGLRLFREEKIRVKIVTVLKYIKSFCREKKKFAIFQWRGQRKSGLKARFRLVIRLDFLKKQCVRQPGQAAYPSSLTRGMKSRLESGC